MSGAVGMMFLFGLVASPAYAQTYTMSLQTNAQSYSGSTPIIITGAITPAPGPDTGVVITIKNPSNAIADVNEVPVDTNGTYSWTSVPGGNSNWVTGTFSVNATWGSSTTTLFQVVTFSYSAATTTTTTTTTTTSTTSTTSTSSTVAEFPDSALAFVALVAVALVAVATRRPDGRGLPGADVAR